MLFNKKIIESKIPGLNNRHLLEERNILSNTNDNYEEKEEYLYSTVIKNDNAAASSETKKNEGWIKNQQTSVKN